MKILSIVVLLSLTCSFCFGQDRRRFVIDSVKHELSVSKHDTSRVLNLVRLGHTYRNFKQDSALSYGQQAQKLANQIGFHSGEAQAFSLLSRLLLVTGNLPKSLAYGFKALQITDTYKLQTGKTGSMTSIGEVYVNLRNYSKALYYYQEAKKILAAKKDVVAEMNSQLGEIYRQMNQLDSALYYNQQAINVSGGPIILRNFGNTQAALGNKKLALEYYQKGVQSAAKGTNYLQLASTYNKISQLYKNINQPDSSIYYAKKGLTEAQKVYFKQEILEASNMLSELYEPTDPKEALRYYKLATTAKDGLFGAGNMQAIQEMITQEEERQKEIENAKIAFQNQLKQYGLVGGLLIMLLTAFFLYRNNLQEKKAKKQLQEKNEVIEHTLTTLKATQNQLIQKEKLASLGELTAGIAHEIQNPLNFVNNFSEVSGELVDEMNEEIDKGNYEEAKEISSDLKQNLQKINHHGKRASNIVKGMLEHSRSSTGERVLTDINALADEYLRLSFHGMKAKNKDFTADFKTDFDPNVPKVEVIPQEIGRVILNLLNNAFYSVGQSGRLSPKVIIATKTLESAIEIRVKDNGNGISKANLAKIFQPFFTTKPTGEGTGLGLSLSYDIVTKGHGGTLEVISVEGEGAEFIVRLPI